jgi:kanamycin nucleotidyltransferase
LNSWKPKKFQTQDRYEIANEIFNELMNKYEDNLISVAIEGSTAKGLDCPESDLELRAVVKGRESEWYPFFYKGMFVGISFNTIEKIQSKATNIDYEWCVKGDALFTCKILHDPTNLYGTLRKKAKAAEDHAEFDRLIKDALADMYEHVYKIYTLKETDTIMAAHEARQVAYWATMCVGLKNRHKFLSSRTMYHESFKLKSLPSDFEMKIKGLLSLNTDLQSLKKNLGDLWTSIYNWAEINGINLEESDLSFL